MPRSLHLCVCLMPLLITSALMALDLEPPPAEWWNGQNRPVIIATTRPAIRSEQLQRVIPKVLFKETKLADAIEFLQQHTDANLRVRWREVTPDGITKDLPVSLQLLNVTAEQALRELLEEAGYGITPLVYRAEGNIVVITKAELAPSQPVARLYDIRDLMLAAMRFSANFPADDRTRQGNVSGGVMFGSGPMPFHGSSEAELARALADHFREAIARDTWIDNGGRLGSISYFAGHLIIVQDEANHAHIYQGLETLRRSLRSPATQTKQ